MNNTKRQEYGNNTNKKVKYVQFLFHNAACFLVSEQTCVSFFPLSTPLYKKQDLHHRNVVYSYSSINSKYIYEHYVSQFQWIYKHAIPQKNK